MRVAVDRQPGLGKIQGLLGLAEVRAGDFASGRKDLEAAFPLITVIRRTGTIGVSKSDHAEIGVKSTFYGRANFG